MDEEKKHPTMIIPAGTEITVNQQGQLSIKTPGNLVIQNSGSYSTIESSTGSIRIDPDVKVEAISLRAADSCFIAGTLTAWRVKAKKIILEKGAQAYIMLQESDSLELDRTARLVGNFASEKELYLMLGRFSRQLGQLTQLIGPREEDVLTLPRSEQPQPQSQPPAQPAPSPAAEEPAEERPEPEEPFIAPNGEEEVVLEETRRSEELLGTIKALLEREAGRLDIDPGSKEALESLISLVDSGDAEQLRTRYRFLLSQVREPSQELEKVFQLLNRYFEQVL